MKRIKSILFFLIGIVSLGLGILGTVLPVLPGGPFYFICCIFVSQKVQSESIVGLKAPYSIKSTYWLF
ncbi:hypothetical protein [Bacillus coahuilensis]|uniref:hypothetical protein n=1 Tax=Bacillus coahuilensis TaxID=408580 RepID=UPI0001850EFF|nr:hypothetical protein [Bacillus coahuilensis]